MKSIFKLLLILVSLTMTLLLEPSALQTNNVSHASGMITHPEYETCVLVSNNIFHGEIKSVEEEMLSDYSGSSTFIASNFLT